MSIGSIIQQIWSGAVKEWTAVEAAIEADVQRVEAVLPSAAPVIADIKQFASDALGTAAAAEATYEPAFVTGVEAAADAAITALAGPYAVALNPMANNAIQDVVSKGNAALQAWALKVQAQFAENAAAKGGGTPTAAPVQ